MNTQGNQPLGHSIRRRLLRLGAATSFAAAMTVGGLGVAGAATKSTTSSSTTHPAPPPGGGIGRPMGTVSAIGSSSVTVTNGNGSSETYTTTASTKYQKDGESSTSAALAVGDIVSVMASGSSSSSADPTATAINIYSPSMSGTVISVNDGTIVVKDQQGFWRTVDLSGSTTYELGGASATSSAVTVGERVMAIGSVDSDHTDLDATAVDVVLPSVMGQVKSVSGSTITLKTPSGTVTVTTTGSTVYDTASGTGSASDVKTGSMVIAEGQQPSSSTLTATSIRVLPAPPTAGSSSNSSGNDGAAGAGPGPGGFGPGGPGGPGGAGSFGGLSEESS